MTLPSFVSCVPTKKQIVIIHNAMMIAQLEDGEKGGVTGS